MFAWCIYNGLGTKSLRLRPWKYNDQVNEYYVVTDDRTLHKKSDTKRDVDETDLGESWQKYSFSDANYIYMTNQTTYI